jgi:hypothetical protein
MVPEGIPHSTEVRRDIIKHHEKENRDQYSHVGNLSGTGHRVRLIALTRMKRTWSCEVVLWRYYGRRVSERARENEKDRRSGKYIVLVSYTHGVEVS